MPKSVTEASEEYVAGMMNKSPTARMAFLAGAEWMRKQFTLQGSDACNACDDGRSTIYAIFEGRCISCEHKRDDSAK